MSENHSTSEHILKRLRIVGIAEGISFLLLLGVAMPLKYQYDLPKAVSIVGGIHGLLFMAYAWFTLSAVLDGMSKMMGVKCILAAIFPFGPFVIDGQLKRLALTNANGVDQ